MSSGSAAGRFVDLRNIARGLTNRSRSLISNSKHVLLICNLLYASLSASAAPPPLPQCGTLTSPKIGSMCYESTKVGVRVKRGDDKESFKNIFQATQPEYVLMDVQIDNAQCNGSCKKPTKNMLSQGGTSSVASTAKQRLTQIQQIRGEAEASAATISGPGYSQAKAKVEALKREEKTYESIVQEMTAAGQDAGKYEVVGWAKPHRCGFMGTDECGSETRATVYVIKRYVGDDTDAYRRAMATANQTVQEIRQLSLASPPADTPKATQQDSLPFQSEEPSEKGVQCPTGSTWNGSACMGNIVQPSPQIQVPPPGGLVQCPMGTVWNGQVCIVQPNQTPQQQGCAPNESPFLCILRGVMMPR